MSLIIALGSNIGHKENNLLEARFSLQKHFHLIAQSQIYCSAPVDYLDQPDFLNQVLEFSIPDKMTPLQALELCLQIEQTQGRIREINRGPRSIDIDILFWDLLQVESDHLTLPHPRWIERSFVIRPLSELPFFQRIKKCFKIPDAFKVEAYPIKMIQG